MPEITVNADDLYAIARAREAFLGNSIDAKRPTAWDQYGWPETLSFEQIFRAYERGGPGQGAVHRILDKCWQRRPRVKAPGESIGKDETALEQAVNALFTPIEGWQKLRDFDRRNLVGRFAGLILRVADGQPLSAPLVRAQRLVDLVPVYESQLKVTQWDSDTASETFGEPTMWQYRMRRPDQKSDTQGRPDDWVDVHPSRIVIMAEGAPSGDFFDGVPLLRAGFNSLIDLEKIAGGSGESYLKNSARTVVIKFEQGASPQAIASEPGSATPVDVKAAIEEKTRALNRNIDSSLVLQGGDASTLQTTVADPEPSFRVAANLFAASVRLPFTILFGQQTGRLASDQDQRDYAERCQSRQVNELTPMMTRVLRRLQGCGLLADGEFEIEWPPMDEPSAEARVERFAKIAAGMKDAAAAGLTEPLVDANEMRGVLDLPERESDGMPEEGDPTADELAAAAQEAAQAAGQQQGATARGGPRLAA